MKDMLGVMFDCSRNGVLSVKTVKKYADILKKMGYNTLLLYIEDTYEIKSQPYFGHLRGRYSEEELKEMDKYCRDIGIELIPCIQTLAHLEAIFKWNGVYSDINDCDSILLAGEDKTYALIEDMLSTLARCFVSKKIHIGMDEAYRVGTGKYQKLHGIEDRFDVINNHLHRVCGIAAKYDLEPMIWSDMFCKLAMNIEDQYESADTSKILEKAKLPENTSLVYWDYYSTDYNRYVENIKTNRVFGRKVYFAGGAWAWKGIAPDNDFSIRTTEVALSACRDEGVKDVFITVWGDDGNECPKSALFPSLMYAAEVYRGNNGIESIEAKFKEITGCNFDDFMLFDKLDWAGGEYTKECMAKNFLYDDVFMGIWDGQCEEKHGAFYGELAKKISEVSEKGEFSYLFDCYGKFASVLEIKSTLGIRIRKAYLENDKEMLGSVVKDMEELDGRISAFHLAYEKAWFTENKPQGFEIMDIRLGGLKQRVLSCKRRIEQYINGEISEIPELCEAVLKKTNGIFWSRIITAGRISMHL
ncbi:MAG: beta-N-acetylhexosaminidase [Oscillospiraceae bacterium]|nr:beta-N-acetylhexosaminidase [Oscillospiraceae bacterium]MBQ7054001.1 beta-N-acetylhexosaminidase [Oscillospiraceae bacterium]